MTDDSIKRLRDALAVGMWDAQRHGDLTAVLDEIDRLRSEAASWEQQAQDRTDDALKFAAERDALREDAERYRHLKETATVEQDDGTVGIMYWCGFEHYADLDASIDAARKGEE
jgi:hypothetical protein